MYSSACIRNALSLVRLLSYVSGKGSLTSTSLSWIVIDVVKVLVRPIPLPDAEGVGLAVLGAIAP
jgi:hypothetical protein